MIIITDTTEYTEKVLGQKFDWLNPKNIGQPPIITELSTRLIKSDKVFIIDTGQSTLWKYMFVVKHAPESQFAAMMEILKDHNFAEGILCLAESGSNFKGYRSRKWTSITGNLHLSMFLNPNKAIESFSTGFTILSTISVVEALNKIAGLKEKSAIKWVNDIYIGKCKISGVLTHTQTTGSKVSGVFLGIGVNVESSPDIEGELIVPKAASLWNFVDNQQSCSQSIVLKTLLERITFNYKKLLKNRYREMLEIYRNNSLVIGRGVKIYSDPIQGEPEFVTEGVVKFIGENLELWLENERHPITKGRIVLR